MKKVISVLIFLLVFTFVSTLSILFGVQSCTYHITDIKGDRSLLNNVEFDAVFGTTSRPFTIRVHKGNPKMLYRNTLYDSMIENIAIKEYVDEIEPFGEWIHTSEEGYKGAVTYYDKRMINGAHISYKFTNAMGKPINIQTDLVDYSNDRYVMKQTKVYDNTGDDLLIEPYTMREYANDAYIGFIENDYLIKVRNNEYYFMPTIDDTTKGQNGVYHIVDDKIDKIISLPENQMYIQLFLIENKLVVLSKKNEMYYLDIYDVQGQKIDTMQFDIQELNQSDGIPFAIYTNNEFVILNFEDTAVIMDVNKMEILYENLALIKSNLDDGMYYQSIDMVYKEGMLYTIQYIANNEGNVKLSIFIQKQNETHYAGEIVIRNNSKADTNELEELVTLQRLIFLRDKPGGV